jgi:hypothetical protein
MPQPINQSYLPHQTHPIAPHPLHPIAHQPASYSSDRQTTAKHLHDFLHLPYTEKYKQVGKYVDSYSC